MKQQGGTNRSGFSWAIVGMIAAVAGMPAALHGQDGSRDGQPAEKSLPAGEAQGQQPDAAPAATQIDEKSKALLEQVQGFYKKIDRVKVTATMQVVTPGQEGETPMNLPMAAARPNKFVIPLGDAEEEYKMVSTGETLYQYIGAPLNKYSEEPAPADFDALARSGMFAESGMGTDLTTLATAPHLILMHLLNGKSLSDVAGISRVEYIGTETLQEQPHEHLRLHGDEADVDIWFRSGEQPWLAQMQPDMTKTFEQYGEMGAQLKESMPKVTLQFKEWEQPTDFPEGTFAFTAPEGAAKVESLMKALREEMGGGEPEEDRQSQLLGKAAPEVGVLTLDGDKLDLSKLKDKVVVLDFWASWCGPCVRALPVLTKVTDSLKDQGVVFYAVNVREDTDTIKTFMEKRKLSMKVALDADGSVSDRYGVTGIPQTVLIGKDGTVQAVHVGLSPDLEEKLTQELKSLLKGEKLHKGDTP